MSDCRFFPIASPGNQGVKQRQAAGRQPGDRRKSFCFFYGLEDFNV